MARETDKRHILLRREILPTYIWYSNGDIMKIWFAKSVSHPLTDLKVHDIWNVMRIRDHYLTEILLTQFNDTYIRKQTSMTFPEKRNQFSQHHNFPLRHATTSCKKDLDVYNGQLFNEVALCTKTRLPWKYGLYYIFSKMQNSSHFSPVTLCNRIIHHDTHIQRVIAVVFHWYSQIITNMLNANVLNCPFTYVCDCGKGNNFNRGISFW